MLWNLRQLLIFYCLMIFSGIAAQHKLETLDIPKDYQQVILVITPNDTTSQGVLSYFERSEEKWLVAKEDLKVSVGKSGLAWGRGLHVIPENEDEKQEGDGKAPAGIFLLGTSFGYSPKSTFAKFPYKQATERDYFVDDIASSDYNSWVSIPNDKANEPKTYWNSVELMKRKDHLYEWGVVVKHNQNPSIASKGSAIFLHIWREEGAPTLGCTAMPKEDILDLLQWLDQSKHPLLIQVTKEQFDQLRFK